MHTELFSVSRIFTESIFRIPDYQRGYAWREKQLKDFWNDVSQLEPGKNHYTGVITLEQVPKPVYESWEDDVWIITSKRYSPYYVVDGQQRLTTIVVFLQVITERLAAEQKLNYSTREEIRKKFIFESKDDGISRSYIFGYEKDNPSYEYLKTKIFLEPSATHSPPQETVYTNNLNYAKKFFEQQLNESDSPQIEALFTRVTQNLLFNIYTISEDIDVFVAFETMNNRGKPLSNLELLKNRLIYLSTKFPAEPVERRTLRTTINECWKSAYHQLGRSSKVPLSDNLFLDVHFCLYFGRDLLPKNEEDDGPVSFRYRHYDDEYKDYLLEHVFTNRNLTDKKESGEPKLTVRDVYEYASDLKRTVVIFFETQNPQLSEYSGEERVFLERLRRLDFFEAVVWVTALYRQVGEPKIRIEFLKTLERLLFLRTISYLKSFETAEINEAAVKFGTGLTKYEEAYRMLETTLAACLKEVDLRTAGSEWGKRMGYYGWKGLRYFLFEYEQSLLQVSRTSREKLDWSQFSREDFEKDYYTVEHIYPQKASEPCWRDTFREYSVKQRNLLRNSLGNLLPLSTARNASFQNKCFAEKRAKEEDRLGYCYGCYSEIEVSQLSDWTAKEILVRGISLLSFLERRWGISLGSAQAKAKLLSLEFLVERYPEIIADADKSSSKATKRLRR